MHRLFLSLYMLLFATTSGAADESWLVTTDRWGNPSHQILELRTDSRTLSGTLDGDALQGSRRGDVLSFTVTDEHGARYVFTGKRSGERITGEADFPDTNHADRRARHTFTARRIPTRPDGPPRTHVFTPATYSNEFSATRAPVLILWPGDSVRTTTLDSGGVDEHGVTRALYGNPQTGPFYIAGAAPGDTIAVHLTRLRLNRDYADSLDGIVPRALSAAQAIRSAALGKPVRWALDLARGTASPQDASGALSAFTVPLRPMLGGLAVAPGDGWPPMSAGDTGRNGGNMDFNEVVEGNVVYLPVFQPGALLYLGDAHALQGDGETSQYGLETSMEVEFRVELVRGKAITMPRIESPRQIFVLGQAGSLDDALRTATDGMLQWLRQDYGLDASEAAQVLGSSVQYRVANLAGRSVGLAAAIDKARLENVRRGGGGSP
ncbi:acetamidase/formamidase family protein [Tahibacter sp.]|uniref:acetamidase/formamidase family protein n=1 Tax=Tahibacter sp. TaxID=2056211 RepID=UPI0028C37980|nr:acetamidase/formamidase family protein [Tahibacter sp.]